MSAPRQPGRLALRGWTHDQVAEHTEQLFRAQQPIIEAFHKIFYEADFTWRMNAWRGYPLLKSPFDQAMLSELVWSLRPQLIVETGTAYGGSALFLADMQEIAQIEGGRVVTIELEERYPLVEHPRLTCLRGSSTAPEIVAQVRAMAEGCPTVLVILDSNHEAQHVAEELEIYHTLVPLGSFLVVEDTNIVRLKYEGGEEGPGPGAALTPFLKAHPEFKSQWFCERYLMTFHPNGWLQRIG